MKIFVVFKGHCEGDDVIEVHSDRERADQKANYLNSPDNPDYSTYDHYYVEEFEVIA